MKMVWSDLKRGMGLRRCGKRKALRLCIGDNVGKHKLIQISRDHDKFPRYSQQKFNVSSFMVTYVILTYVFAIFFLKIWPHFFKYKIFVFSLMSSYFYNHILDSFLVSKWFAEFEFDFDFDIYIYIFFPFWFSLDYFLFLSQINHNLFLVVVF